MADALCGSSNPLQTLKSYSQVDRTLQRDRIHGARDSPAQGFRSIDPRAGSLDAEFAAFEAGPPQPFRLQQQPPFFPFQQFGSAAQPYREPGLRDVQSAPGWAADFQKLHLGPAQIQPIPQHRFSSEAPMARPNISRSPGDWHGEFMRQQQQQQHLASIVGGKLAVRSPVIELDYLQGPSVSPSPLAHLRPGAYQASHNTSDEDVYWDLHADVASKAAFEAAFAQAEGALISDENKLQAHLSEGGAVSDVHLDHISRSQSLDLNTTQFDAPQTPGNSDFRNRTERQPTTRIGSDAIPYSDRKAPRTSEQNSIDADELARTAGQLLDSVSHEKSSKFEQSQFLALMRRIRDREVEVHGEEFREIDKNANMTTSPVSREHVSKSSLPPEAQMRIHTQTTESGQQESVAVPIGGHGRFIQDQMAQRTGRSYQDYPELSKADAATEGRQLDGLSAVTQDAQALHPGGKGYPALGWDSNDVSDDDGHKYDHWASGGIGLDDERAEKSLG